MNIREKFEEIWPVPEGVVWCRESDAYYFEVEPFEHFRPCEEMNHRLDTFTRCQETSDVYASLVDELVFQLEAEDRRLNDAADLIRKEQYMASLLAICHDPKPRRDILSRAKQIMEQKK